MPVFTIVIPTHSHVATLHWAIQSVVDQTERDFELFVVGDGAPVETTTLMSYWCSRDSRIRYLANPKGDGNGEYHRHVALQQASGDLVAYLGDDDLWLPHHLSTLKRLLERHDFAHTTMAHVNHSGNVIVQPGRLDTVYGRQCLLNLGLHPCGPSSVGHTLAAYNRLPYGWRAKPRGVKSDTHMWLQWLAQTGVSVGYELCISSLHIGSGARGSVSDEERGLESKAWYELSRKSGIEDELLEDYPSFLQKHILHRKHIKGLLDSILSGELPSPESTALLALSIAEPRKDAVTFTLRTANQSFDGGGHECARLLYEAVAGKIRTPADVLLGANYLMRSGDLSSALKLLDFKGEADIAQAEKLAALKDYCLSRLNV